MSEQMKIKTWNTLTRFLAGYEKEQKILPTLDNRIIHIVAPQTMNFHYEKSKTLKPYHVGQLSDLTSQTFFNVFKAKIRKWNNDIYYT